MTLTWAVWIRPRKRSSAIVLCKFSLVDTHLGRTCAVRAVNGANGEQSTHNIAECDRIRMSRRLLAVRRRRKRRVPDIQRRQDRIFWMFHPLPDIRDELLMKKIDDDERHRLRSLRLQHRKQLWRQQPDGLLRWLTGAPGTRLPDLEPHPRRHRHRRSGGRRKLTVAFQIPGRMLVGSVKRLLRDKPSLRPQIALSLLHPWNVQGIPNLLRLHLAILLQR